ncbi:MAG: hypothetical protein ACXWWX_07540 [Actinomycetota bacterium]
MDLAAYRGGFPVLCRIARERGALSFVDDYHGLGICRSTCTTSAATCTPPGS